MRAPKIILLIALALVVLGGSHTSAAEDAPFKLIVHPDNRVDVVGRDFVRDAYLKKATTWRGGTTLRPVDLTSKFAVRDRFTHDVLRKTPAQLRTYWNQQIFSGKGVPPPELDSTASVVAFVLANPGAIGYVPAGTDTGKARVVGIK
jgi:ABC-type phosphate transport system substrate-binding protein